MTKSRKPRQKMALTTSYVLIYTLIASACTREEEDPLPVLTADQTERIIAASYRDYDYNRDKKVTCSDVARLRADQFAALDKDGNGKLSSGEYRFAKFEDADFNFQDYRRLDEDENGTITADEFAKVLSNRFAGLDRDKNCIVTEDEMILAGRIALDGRRVRGERGPRPQRQSGANKPAPKKRPPTEIEEIDDIPPKTGGTS